VTISGSITNPDNDTLKYVRSLRDKKRARYQEKRYVIEGLRLVAHALYRGYRPVLAFCTKELSASPEGQALLERLDVAETSVWVLTSSLLNSISDTVSPQGIVAVMPMLDPHPDQVQGATLLLVLDRIGDPGNLGTMLRTAHAATFEAALLSIGCVDPYSPKVVRAGMGAHLDLPVLLGVPWPEIARLTQGTPQRVLADAGGERTIWDVDWSLPTTLIIGSEAHGPRAEAQALATMRARLPMAEGAESLNAAIAMAVSAFEALRQRRRSEAG
jgi:RNA methyltransferase, TrmH family